MAEARSNLLDQDQALDAAARILKGDPYGNTRAEIANGIKLQMLIVKGADPCKKEPLQTPIWVFSVKAIDKHTLDEKGQPQKIDGLLTLDASSGKLSCATLPFLD